MCGFTAILTFNNSSLLNRSTLFNMTKEILHRGPDDEGYFLNEWVGFGFRRLSILDVSLNGHQPMYDVSGNYIIIFNGEIYNYKALKDELLKKNYKFNSNTDTEVLLNAYIEWGSLCLHKLEGMFAFMIYDKTREEVFVARDHLGIKPLYYLEFNNTFFFGSEIKVFKNIVKFRLNEDRLYEQFVYSYVSGKDTIFKNIFRVQPGMYMLLNKKGLVSQNNYYNVIDTLMDDNSAKLDLEEIKNELDQSILKHTMSDVGYNVQLSGGVDSSYITAVLSKKYGQTLHTYSVTLNNFKRNENKYQKIVSKRYNTIHHSYPLGCKELLDNYEKATWHYDMPLITPGNVFLMLLCKHSNSNSKVILTGEGSDELFGGYLCFKRFQLYKYNILNFLQWNNILVGLLPNLGKLRSIKNSINNIILGIDQSAYFSKEKSQSLFNRINEDIEYRRSVVTDINRIPNKILASFQTSYLNFLLERQDKMSMAMSVEARVPYCNYLLFNKINRIPVNRKIKPVRKAILKKLSEQYYDRTFIYRKKNGFDLPLGNWLKDDAGLKPWFDFLTDKTFCERGFYNHKNISSLVNKHLKGGKDYSNLLINIINFEIWHRFFID